MALEACEGIHVSGRFTLSLLDKSGTLADERSYPNIVTVNGLTILAASLAYSGISNIAASLGFTTPITPNPLYGCVGTSSTAVTQLDTALNTQVATGAAVAGFGIQAVQGTPSSSSCNWTFYLGGTSTNYTLAEAGVFAQGNSMTGTLISHASLSPTFSWSTGYNLQLQYSLIFQN